MKQILKVSLKLDPMLRNWSELLSFNQSSKSFHHFSDCMKFVIRCAAFKTESHVSLGNLFRLFVCFQVRIGCRSTQLGLFGNRRTQ